MPRLLHTIHENFCKDADKCIALAQRSWEGSYVQRMQPRILSPEPLFGGVKRDDANNKVRPRIEALEEIACSEGPYAEDAARLLEQYIRALDGRSNDNNFLSKMAGIYLDVSHSASNDLRERGRAALQKSISSLHEMHLNKIYSIARENGIEITEPPKIVAVQGLMGPMTQRDMDSVGAYLWNVAKASGAQANLTTDSRKKMAAALGDYANEMEKIHNTANFRTRGSYLLKQIKVTKEEVEFGLKNEDVKKTRDTTLHTQDSLEVYLSGRIFKDGEEEFSFAKVGSGAFAVTCSPEPPNTLSFSGAGAKGVGYLGCLEALDDAGLLRSISHVKGTSAGAILAALVATGVSKDKISEFFSNLRTGLLLGDANQSAEENENFIYAAVKACINGGSDASNLKRGIDALMVNSIKDHLSALTQPLPQDVKGVLDKINNSKEEPYRLTFEDLQILRKHYPERYKDLEVFATTKAVYDASDAQLGGCDDHAELVSGSASTCPKAFISEMVFGSMSLPYIYRDGVLYFGGGRIEIKDGGFMINTPSVHDARLIHLMKLNPFGEKPLIFAFFSPQHESETGEIQTDGGIFDTLASPSALAHSNMQKYFLKENFESHICILPLQFEGGLDLSGLKGTIGFDLPANEVNEIKNECKKVTQNYLKKEKDRKIKAVFPSLEDALYALPTRKLQTILATMDSEKKGLEEESTASQKYKQITKIIKVKEEMRMVLNKKEEAFNVNAPNSEQKAANELLGTLAELCGNDQKAFEYVARTLWTETFSLDPSTSALAKVLSSFDSKKENVELSGPVETLLTYFSALSAELAQVNIRAHLAKRVVADGLVNKEKGVPSFSKVFNGRPAGPLNRTTNTEISR